MIVTNYESTATRQVSRSRREIEVHYLGQWLTPWWGDGTRAGFVAKTTFNRHDFGVSCNDKMDNGGIVVSDTVEITIDAEAILEASDMLT
jgi:polyisoprenoid-binding protein YceI